MSYSGARQTGKTTLLHDLLGLPATSRFSLDQEATRRRATDDPVGFVEALPRPSDNARHLVWMRERLGARFMVGLVVHAGQVTLPLGEGIWAVPISALWRNDR